jgi:hypothetical protein
MAALGPPIPKRIKSHLKEVAMAPRVLVSDKLSTTAVQIFRDRGVEVDYLPDLGKAARSDRPV